jgi:phosphoribosyl-ATP pyrophosphohydrolase/phosphoribosyl-AMP cyclohydrolase
MLDLDRLDFDKGSGVVTVVTQDARSGVVLMVAHADRAALERAIETGEMHYRSRTRGLWHKGSTSGNTQAVVSLEADCDGDAVLARVIPRGPACHTNAVSCFGEAALAADALATLDRTVRARAAESIAGTPPGDRPSYTRRLLDDRNLRLKKLGEESAELVAAAADGDAARATEEAADLVYHALVALRGVGVGWDELRAALWARIRS